MNDMKRFIGKTPIKIVKNYNEIIFYFDKDNIAMMYHYQDCCEEVRLDDINGDLKDLIGKEIIIAEERTDHNKSEDLLWTFYTFRNNDVSIDIRWDRDTHSYYSTDIDVEWMTYWEFLHNKQAGYTDKAVLSLLKDKELSMKEIKKLSEKEEYTGSGLYYRSHDLNNSIYELLGKEILIYTDNEKLKINYSLFEE